jgi:hypothetical protein
LNLTFFKNQKYESQHFSKPVPFLKPTNLTENRNKQKKKWARPMPQLGRATQCNHMLVYRVCACCSGLLTMMFGPGFSSSGVSSELWLFSLCRWNYAYQDWFLRIA